MKCQSFSPVKQKSSLDVGKLQNVIHPAHPQIEPRTILFSSQFFFYLGNQLALF